MASIELRVRGCHTRIWLLVASKKFQTHPLKPAEAEPCF